MPADFRNAAAEGIQLFKNKSADLIGKCLMLLNQEKWPRTTVSKTVWINQSLGDGL